MLPRASYPFKARFIKYHRASANDLKTFREPQRPSLGKAIQKK